MKEAGGIKPPRPRTDSVTLGVLVLPAGPGCGSSGRRTDSLGPGHFVEVAGNFGSEAKRTAPEAGSKEMELEEGARGAALWEGEEAK